MNLSDVLVLIAENKNERGIEHWRKQENPAGLQSYGVGLTQLRKLAKKIGRNHQLAIECWQSTFYDVKLIGLLIDEPKKITFEQAESQVEDLAAGMLVHVFSSCDATLSKSPIAYDLFVRWRDSEDILRKKSAYGLLYELSKNNRDKRLTDDFFFKNLEHIDQTIKNQSKSVRFSMGSALMAIGKRNLALNKAAIEIALRIGAIDFNEGDSNCEPFNILKHLKSEYLKKKFGM